MELPGLNDLEDFLDKNILCLFHNDKWMSGILRSFDKFGNLTIEDGEEVIIKDNIIDRMTVGTVIIRGENINYFGLLNENYESMFISKKV